MRTPIHLISSLLVLLLAPHVSPLVGVTIPTTGDEFVGPFPSWSTATSYGASGNGINDDTIPLQRALDELGQGGRSPVLFLPAGTYRITRTLTLSFAINLSIVGQHPATTIIRWDGPAGGTMLHINGVAYSRIDRLTFDGRRVASVAVEQSWDGSRPHFDTGNQYSDDVFMDVEFGLHGGFKGHGFAETSIRRARFLRNTRAGLALCNFNALDAWVWNSTFEDCAIGVSNTPGAGNFRVYNSTFRRSTVTDMAIGNTGGFSARGNFSIGSKAFFTAGGTNNPATIHLQGNTILDTLDATAIRVGNQGPGLITDNIIRSRAGAAGPAVSWVGFLDSDVASVGNTFTVPNPVRASGRSISVDDRVVARDTIDPAVPETPPTPGSAARQIIEVPREADAADIQNLLIAAARRNGQRPIVHFSHGIYAIDETLTVPPSDLQIVGDGCGTILRWTGSGVGPVLTVKGPSKSTLREIQIDGAGKANGLVVENADQHGARVYMDQAQMRGGRNGNLHVNGLRFTNVQLEDIGYAGSPNGPAVRVSSGPIPARATAGKTNVFSGASSGNGVSYDVSGGARVLVRDLWYESGAAPGFARVRDQAVFTVDGARISSPVNGTPAAFDIANLSGKVAILVSDIDDRITVSGDGRDASVMALGVVREQRDGDYFANEAAPRARAALLNPWHLSSMPGIRTAATSDTLGADPTFIRMMLAHARRERPETLKALPSGVSDVRLFRVWVANGLTNITLLPSASADTER